MPSKNVNRFLAIFLSIALLQPSGVGVALPTGENVVAGTADFQRLDQTLNITASDQSIIEYSNFDIGTDETVNFFLPSTDSFSLNRILGGLQSNILGSLTANGNLLFVNAAGFYFGSQP